jgi:predicted DNA-binding protein (MmcQ/YjbR family)
MNIEELRAYCLQKREVTEVFPFDENTLTFKVLGKIFALFPLDKWEKGEGQINLKCDPNDALELRETYASIVGGFHSNKKHWNTMYLYKGELQPQLVCQLIDHSYDMVVKGMTKKMRLKLVD